MDREAIDVDPEPAGAFVRRWLPSPRARVLEVGAGEGELARSLAEDGYEVRAIDPGSDAEGVEALALEDLEIDDPFDAVVALRSLHHLEDLPGAIGALSRALAPSATLIAQGFAWDLVDFSTGSWLYAESVRLDLEDVSRDPVAFYESWREEHRHLLGYPQLRALLDAVTDEVHFAWVPYLADAYLDGDEHARRREREQLAERRLHSGAFRYVGRRSA